MSFLFRIARGAARLYLRTFFRFEHAGTEHLPPSGPFIVAANHQGYYDPVAISAAAHRKIHFMAWDAWFKVPFIGRAMLALGAFPVSQDRADSGAIKTALEILGRGDALGIFPEGALSLDGRMKHMKPGVVKIALESGAPIVPCAIYGTHRVRPKGSFYPRVYKIKVKFGPPLAVAPTPEGAHARRHMTNELVRISDAISELLIPRYRAREIAADTPSDAVSDTPLAERRTG